MVHLAEFQCDLAAVIIRDVDGCVVAVPIELVLEMLARALRHVAVPQHGIAHILHDFAQRLLYVGFLRLFSCLLLLNHNHGFEFREGFFVEYERRPLGGAVHVAERFILGHELLVFLAYSVPEREE